MIWLIVAGVLVVAEVVTVTLVLGMLAVGALAAGVLGLFGAPFVVQLLAFAIASAGLLAFVRPPLKNVLDRGGNTERTDPRMLGGSIATVVERVHDDGGRVRLNGELWRARPYAGTAPVESGRAVSVAAIDGATLLVYDPDLS